MSTSALRGQGRERLLRVGGKGDCAGGLEEHNAGCTGVDGKGVAR
jgi:hypothetical protein